MSNSEALPNGEADEAAAGFMLQEVGDLTREIAPPVDGQEVSSTKWSLLNPSMETSSVSVSAKYDAVQQLEEVTVASFQKSGDVPLVGYTCNWRTGEISGQHRGMELPTVTQQDGSSYGWALASLHTQLANVQASGMPLES